jgi:hypothetical protein
MEGIPRRENEPIEMEQDETGTYVMNAKELIQSIPGYEEMQSKEKVGALVSLMQELSADRANRFVIEELARHTREVELYAEIEERKQELSRLGKNIDTYV